MDEPEDTLCEDCAGTGRVTYYPGGYGTSYCKGPAEQTCETCEGEGMVGG